MTIGKFKFVLWVESHATGFESIKAMALKYDWTYYAVGAEIAPTTGRLHMDGYYEMSSQRKKSTELNKWNKMFGKGFGDLDIARGSHGENFDYSEKEGREFLVFGNPSLGQGSRSDLIVIKDDIVSGRISVDEIVLQDPMTFHQYGRTLQKIEDIALRKRFREWMTLGTWCHGSTGVGKSHLAFTNYNPETHYLWKNDKGWQDGYTGQPIVIINDFRGEIPYNDLLQLVDKWPYTLPRRGREPVPFLARHVIITSSLTPQQIYNRRDIEDSIEQLLRRFEVIEIKKGPLWAVGL